VRAGVLLAEVHMDLPLKLLHNLTLRTGWLDYKQTLNLVKLCPHALELVTKTYVSVQDLERKLVVVERLHC